MINRIIGISLLGICIAFLAYLFESECAAHMIGLSTEELTNAADTIIVGDVEQVEAHWNENGTAIVSSATILVNEVLKDGITQKRIIVEYEGGEVGDIGLKVSDVSSMAKGEKVIVFLKSEKSKTKGVSHKIVGKGQGKYTIDADGIARKKGFTVSGRQEVIDNNIPSSMLIEKIKGIK